MSDTLPTIDELGRKYGIIEDPYPAYDSKRANEFIADITRLMDKREIEGQIKELNYWNEQNGWDYSEIEKSRYLTIGEDQYDDRITELEQQLKSLNSNEESGDVR